MIDSSRLSQCECGQERDTAAPTLVLTVQTLIPNVFNTPMTCAKYP